MIDMGGAQPTVGSVTRAGGAGQYKEASCSCLRHEEQANKQYSFIVSASVPVSRFLP